MAMGTARGEEDVEKITIKNKPTTSLTDGIIVSDTAALVLYEISNLLHSAAA